MVGNLPDVEEPRLQHQEAPVGVEEGQWGAKVVFWKPGTKTIVFHLPTVFLFLINTHLRVLTILLHALNHGDVVLRLHTSGDRVTRRKNIATSGRCNVDTVSCLLDYLLPGSKHQIARAIDVPHEADSAAILPLHLLQAHSRQGVNGVKTVGLGIQQEVHYRHQITVRMLHYVQAGAMPIGVQSLHRRADDLGDVPGRHE